MEEDAISSTTDTDVEEEEEDDIISSLPDEILCIILSNFSTKESVRTSILSKRWRYVWTSVPNLLIDDDDIYKHGERVCDHDNCFVNFINRLFLLHKSSCIQKFHLSCSFKYEPAIVSAWINTAILRNVEEIVLKVYDTDVELSPSFFTCKKLVVLELGFNFFVNVPESVSFPNLKILILCLVPHFDDDSVKNLLSGCPVLEELDISACYRVHNLCIQSPTLKKLKLEYFCDDYERCKLVIESPNLQYLDLIDCETEDVTVTFQPSLVEAHISVSNMYLPHDILDEINCDKFIKLLQSISNTKHLEVACVRMQITTLPVSDFPNLPVFLNLTFLKVVVSDHSWDILPFLLEFSPHLHTCFIDKMDHNYLLSGCEWKSPYIIPKCLLLCLEEIVITGFKACNNEIEMVEYFLKNGRVLKKMLIESVKLCPEEKSNVSKKLLEFPKASSTCQISFS